MSVPLASGLQRTLAVAVAVALVAAGIPTRAAGTASLTGIVVRAETAVPVAGARVHVADPATGDIVSSGPTSATGGFEVAGLGVRAYEIGIEVDGGLYVIAEPLEIDGDTPSLRLAVGPPPSDPGGMVRLAPGARRSAVWDRPLTATLLILGIAAATALAVDQIFGGGNDGESNPSPTSGT